MNVFEQKFKVELEDITPSFGLKPTSILKYYQETFARYCAKYNVAGYDVYQMGLKWVFGQTIIDFFDTIPIWNEEVIAKVYVTNVKRLRIFINFDIETKRGVIAKGQSVAFILDLETSRPKPIDAIVGKLKLDKDSTSGEILTTDFVQNGTLISDMTHKINFSDLDYNNHTNNISYISLAFEGMPNMYINKKYPKTLEIKYLQETFLNDELNCQIFQNGDDFSYKISNLKDGSDVCVINANWNNKSINQNDFFDIMNSIKLETELV